METTVAEIQVESKDEKESVEISPQDEEQVEKASMICFKRRKKSAKALKSKNCSEKALSAPHHTGPRSAKHHTEVEASDQFQSPGGTWAAIRRLVTRQKRSKSSKKQVPLDAKTQPKENTGNTKPAKKKARPRIKIPCIKLSRSKKKCSHSQIIEESECNMKVKEVTDTFDTKIQTPRDAPAGKDKLIADVSGDSSQGGSVSVPQVSNISSSAENVASIELGVDTEPCSIHTTALILEKAIEKTEEKQVVNFHPESLPETSEAGHQLPKENAEVGSVVAPDETPAEAPATPETPIVEETSKDGTDQEPKEKEHESGVIASEKNESKDNIVCFSKPDFKENAVGPKTPQLEESKRMEPIAIIVTDTEVSEFDVKKSKNVPKKFLISAENQQSEPFSNAVSSQGVNDFEGRTSEQYEKLLIETASSLVKNAIQLSIEQLVNEMDADDNKRNNLI
ncbi:A-kinase anchor protein 5 [Dromiciops gliroides]|uniref:A-kinase anchor protein 5 n=1 Tax=Dromiciops gliroides TaxID=33562 RepID=UPI001CC50D15|nr:A-kinase anchor protein 5 [Dromiciops gliroides]XP_043837495.1 A-kinase anchor protein 5 [Dromiciops gliroides]